MSSKMLLTSCSSVVDGVLPQSSMVISTFQGSNSVQTLVLPSLAAEALLGRSARSTDQRICQSTSSQLMDHQPRCLAGFLLSAFLARVIKKKSGTRSFRFRQLVKQVVRGHSRAVALGLV